MSAGLEPLAVDQWIMATLLGDGPLQALLGADYADRVWTDVAPESIAGIVIVSTYQQDADDLMGVGSARWGVRGSWIVKAITPGMSYEPVRAIYQRVDAVLHGASGNVADGTVFAFRREAPVRYPEQANDQHYRHLGGRYTAWAQ